jgi:hypothetical protein
MVTNLQRAKDGADDIVGLADLFVVHHAQGNVFALFRFSGGRSRCVV